MRGRLLQEEAVVRRKAPALDVLGACDNEAANSVTNKAATIRTTGRWQGRCQEGSR